MNVRTAAPDESMSQSRLAVTVPEAGRLLGLSRNSAYAAAERGELPTIRIGKRLIVPLSRLEALLNDDAAPEGDVTITTDAHHTTGESRHE